MHGRSRRGALAAAALGALVLAACAPVAPSPSPPAPTPPAPQVTTCGTNPITTEDGKTQYFAVVDHGAGPDTTVTFDAANAAEKQADVAQIEATKGDVVAVEPDQAVRATDYTDEPMYHGSNPGPQWGIDQATFPTAWGPANANSKGAGITVAVVDTGVQASHPDLAGAVLPGTDFVASGGGDGSNDQNGHGTHVAGILGARDQEPIDTGGIGGAPEVNILPVRVLDASGSGSYSGVVAGIDYAVAHGADVISMSLGGGGASAALQTSVSNAIAAGVVVVAAAGNNGSCTTLYPAAYALSVAATQQTPADTLAGFSQHGSGVDIAAPGAVIWSDIPTSAYGYKSGTSMATPFVAAAAALLLAKCPAYTPQDVENRLEATAAPIPSGNTIQSSPPSGALRAGAATAGPC